ncbi:hypothetical protein [Pseudohalocynthiibacter sp. F2068]|jgi:hypothetical protein|uniref:hypothetical protein n=1 Tax=Pseudohalocynthiibacter sp. F2068 TaxID=2926418 RepID=UPI001FF1C549|nr:hypothetical protein [Pseudohalocynthiibacter sp. F2068]MCK0102542.1 hypothetical protein [Pseudohalocynthiibacter sp. F2068]
MALNHRIKKLEQLTPPKQEWPTVFVYFGEEVDHAIIPGSTAGKIDRQEGESEKDFKRRVYAIKGSGKA